MFGALITTAATTTTTTAVRKPHKHYVLRLSDLAMSRLNEAKANAIAAQDLLDLQEKVRLMKEQAKSRKNASQQNMEYINRSTEELKRKIDRATNSARMSAAAVDDFERDAEPKRENFEDENTYNLAMEAHYVKLEELRKVQENIAKATIASHTWMSKIMDTLTWVAQKLMEMVHAAIDVVMEFAREAARLIQEAFNGAIEFLNSVTY